MSAPHVLVVGGGLAGIAAALDCADAGARVSLLEARPRLGGATWSSRQGGLWIDNGQHVFLRCCSAYRGLLVRLGVADRVALQRRLAIPVLTPEPRTHWLRRQALPPPLHLAWSLSRFTPLRRADRWRAARLVAALGRLDLDDRRLDDRAFGHWLAERGADEPDLEAFFDLLLRPTLNLPAREASLALAAKVFQTGLLESAGGADLGVPRAPLQALHGDAAERALARARASVTLRARVTRVEAGQGGRGPAAWVDGRRLGADAVVLAAPHEAAAALLPADAGIDPEALRGLGRSPIVNLHVAYDRRVTRLDVAAGFGTAIEWVFDRTRESGFSDGQLLAVTLSAADAYVGLSRAALRERFLPELARLFPRARGARVLRFLVTCERAATFRQRAGTLRARPGPRTTAPGIHLAGAWTDTGWPATMEGAVRSGRAAARAALETLRRAGARLAAAA